MKKIILGSVAFSFLLLLVILHIQIQPTGSARVLRSDQQLTFIGSRVGWARGWASESCLVPLENGLPLFREVIVAKTPQGEPFDFEVAVTYQLPVQAPAGWPAGDWCRAFSGAIATELETWLASISRDELLADPRGAGWKAAEGLTRTLGAEGLQVRSAAVRPRISEEVLSTRPVASIAARAVSRPPVIVLGLDGGDWEYLDFLMEKGAMPHLARLRREGTSGDLLTEHPALSPLLWTTMMTGASPLEHGILDFTRFHPSTGTKEPITSDERKVPAIWNMTTDGGKDVAVLGLWATYPAEPVRGTIVSDRFFTFLYQEDEPPPGIVWPPFREPLVRKLLDEVEREVGFEMLRNYLPWLTLGEYEQHRATENPYGHPISALRRILVETTLYDRIAAELMESALPDLSIVYLQGTDTVGHMFAPFAPPRQPEISQEDFDRYSQVPELYFRHIDGLIGKYLQLAEDRGARLLLVSDHGFHWFEGRPVELSSFAQATAAKWHRKEGIYLSWGEGIPAGRREPRGIREVCATLLAMTGLPPADSIETRSLPGVESPSGVGVDYRTHYQPVKPVLETSTAGSADEEISKLRALGYIGAGEAMTSPAGAVGTKTAGSWNNEGLIHREAGNKEEAVRAFEKAIELDPNLSSALWNLSDSLFASNEIDRADELLTRAFANDLPEGRKFLIGRAIGYQRSGSPERSLALLEAAVLAKPDDVELRMFRGRYRIEMGDCRGALQDFQAAASLDPGSPVPPASAGLAADCLGDGELAERLFQQSLSINPNQPQLRRILAGRH